MKGFLERNIDAILASFIILLCAFVAIFLIDYSVISDRISALSYSPSPELEELTQEIAPTSEGQLILASTHPALQNAADFRNSCPVEIVSSGSVLGCYGDNRIYVYDIEREELDGIVQSTLAHELLHAVWDRLSAQERNELTIALDQFYGDHQDELSEYLESYDATYFYNELHSLVGTWYASTGIEVLDRHYDKYFTDRSRIASFFEAYHSTFQELSQSLTQLYTTIEANQSQLNDLTTNYSDAVSELNAAIADFNTRASSGAFTSVEAFEAERNTLIAQQEALENLRLQIVALIDTTNSLITEYNEKLIYANNLVDAIDASLEVPPVTISN